jgi:hypothetical protein
VGKIAVNKSEHRRLARKFNLPLKSGKVQVPLVGLGKRTVTFRENHVSITYEVGRRVDLIPIKVFGNNGERSMIFRYLTTRLDRSARVGFLFGRRSPGRKFIAVQTLIDELKRKNKTQVDNAPISLFTPYGGSGYRDTKKTRSPDEAVFQFVTHLVFVRDRVRQSSPLPKRLALAFIRQALDQRG